MEKAINSHNINKANPASKMFPTLPHFFVVITFSITKSSQSQRKITRAAEVELLVCFITGAGGRTLLIF